MVDQSPPQDPLAAFQALPGPMRVFLMSETTQNSFLSLLKKFEVTGGVMDKIVDFIGDLDLKFRKLEELVPFLTKELQWPEDRAKKFAIELAGTRYLPISDFLNGAIWTQIEKWGGDPKIFPATKIEARKVTAQILKDEIIKESRLALTPRLSERVDFLLDSRLAGARDDIEFVTMLTRPEKVGGANLSEADADRLIGILRLKTANAQIVTETVTEAGQKSRIQNPKLNDRSAPPSPNPLPSREGGSSVPRVKEKPTAEESLPASKKFLGPGTDHKTLMEESTLVVIKKPSMKTFVSEEDEPEIAEMKNQITKSNSNEASYNKAIQESITAVVRDSKLTFPDLILTNRLRTVIEARLRDVRDSTETHTLVMKPIVQGGLALTGAQADLFADLVDAEFLALQKQSQSLKTKEKITYTQNIETQKKDQVTNQTISEQEGLDNRFLETVKKSKVLKGRGVILPPSPPTPIKPISPPPTPTSTPKITPILSPGSVPPTPAEKPRLEDVKFTQKILGPIEELRTMTIIEFRRFSKDPKEATLKIKDKIEILKEEGYEKYSQAIRAWLESEPNRLYLDLTRTALETGNPVPATIEERTKSGTPTLTLPEFQAILTLNSQLRF